MKLELKPPGVFARFDREELKPLYDLSLKLEKDVTEYESMNRGLAGNISKQIVLNSYYKNFISTLLDPLLREHINEYTYIKQQSTLATDCPIELTQAWMVLQEKYEFNPIHSHTGVFSFVIWLKIPYSCALDEYKTKGGNSNPLDKFPGTFHFLATSDFRATASEKIVLDSTYEKTILIFPSDLQHCVYPFYTSDEYRISVSGNLYLNF